MVRLFLTVGIMLLAAGLFLVIYDYARQTIAFRSLPPCPPGSSCPMIGYSFQDAYMMAGFAMLGTGIMIVIIYFLKTISKLEAR